MKKTSNAGGRRRQDDKTTRFENYTARRKSEIQVETAKGTDWSEKTGGHGKREMPRVLFLFVPF